jgi:hypothetical protein
MRELAIAGFIAVVFGLGSFYATDHFGGFSAGNLLLGGTALAVSAVYGSHRLRSLGGPHSRPVILRGIALILGAMAIAIATERAAHVADVRFDWTFEGRYEPAEATRKVLASLTQPLEILLFYDPLDPRVRRTRLLVRTLAGYGDVRVRELALDEVPDEVDAYGVGSSNSLVLRMGEAYEVVERPTEGAIFEGLHRLASVRAGVIAVLRGDGEGDLEREDELGFGGLASAITTEGYDIRVLVSAALEEVPEGVGAVLAIAPQRRLRKEALDALRRYLARGGRLVAFLEPDVESGIEEILAEWGLATPQAVLVDPASGAVEGRAGGLCPVAYNYEQHPVTAGLDRNRMTFFCGVRTFRLRKPKVDDRLHAVVQSSPRAWLTEDLSVLAQRAGEIEMPPGIRGAYLPIAVAGRYSRDGNETRIFAVGDSDFASNRYLRTLYNLDLVMNGIHWVMQRESASAIRPKIRDTVQFPLPIQNSLQTLYGVGLLLPELLLIAGGVVWLRRRSA